MEQLSPQEVSQRTALISSCRFPWVSETGVIIDHVIDTLRGGQPQDSRISATLKITKENVILEAAGIADQ